MSIKEQALEFALKHDLAVIPLEPGTKKPLEMGWATMGRRTADQIDAMPEGNYGVLTEGITVVDFDPRNMDVSDPEDDNMVSYMIDLIRRTYGLTETLEIATGSGGVHLYYLGESRPGKLEKGVDIKSGPASQVVGPGSLHIVTGKPYRVWNDVERMDILPSLLEARGPISSQEWDGKTTNEPKEEGIVKGNRDEGLFKHLCHMRRKGLGDTEMRYYAYAINQTQVHPPLTQPEVDKLIRQAIQYEPGTAALESLMVDAAITARKEEDRPSGWLNLDEIHNLPEPSYLVDGMLPDRGVGHMVGKSYAGKTFVALDLALSLAQGRDTWFGHRIVEGGCRVAYVAMEGGFDLGQRVDAWTAHNGPVPADRMNFLVEEPEFSLMTKEGLDFLEYLSTDYRPGLLIIDTQALAAPGLDENDNAKMSDLMGACKNISTFTGAHVMLVHHAGYSAERARGASSQYASMDVSFYVNTTKDEKSKTLKMTKLKAGPLVDEMAFTLEKSQNSVVVQAADPLELLDEEYPELVEFTPAQQKIHDVLEGLTAGGHRVTVKTVSTEADYSVRTVRPALNKLKGLGLAGEFSYEDNRPSEWWYIEPETEGS